MGLIIMGMIFWNLHLLKTNSELKKEISKIEEKYQYLEAYNKVLQYDLVTSRDSVRILDGK